MAVKAKKIFKPGEALEKVREPEEAADELLGSIMGRAGKTFHMMDIAEELIATKRKDKGDRIDRSFGILVPSTVLLNKSLDLYRAHVQEILSRVESNQDTRPATDAECLAALSDMSLQAPPGQDMNAAIHQLFRTVFPHSGLANPEENKEYIPGGAQEVISKLRKKLSVSERVSKDA